MGSGATGRWWTSSKRTARRDMHGREAGACARGVVRPNLPWLPTNFRPLLPPSIQKFGQHGAPAHVCARRRPTRHRPRRPVGLRRLAHRALRSAPARCPLSRSPRPRPPLFRLCTGPRGEHPRGGATSPPLAPCPPTPRIPPSHSPHVRASPHSAPSSLALTALSPRCTVHPAAHPLQAPVTEPTRSHG